MDETTTPPAQPTPDSVRAPDAPSTSAMKLFGSPAQRAAAHQGTSTPEVKPTESASPTPPAPVAPQAPKPVTPVTPPVTPVVPPVAATPPAESKIIAVDDEALKKLATSIFTQVRADERQNAPVAPVAPKTPEQQAQEQAEFRKAINYYEPTEQDLATILQGGPEGAKALAAVLENKTKQAAAIAHMVARQLVDQQQQQVRPYIQMADQMRENQTTQEFYTEFADLKGFEAVVNWAVQSLNQQGKKYNGTKEVFTQVATLARQQIEKLRGPLAPAGGGTPASTNGQPKQSSTPAQSRGQMTTLPSGGQSGGGVPANDGAKGTPNSTAMKLFGGK